MDEQIRVELYGGPEDGLSTTVMERPKYDIVACDVMWSDDVLAIYTFEEIDPYGVRYRFQGYRPKEWFEKQKEGPPFILN